MSQHKLIDHWGGWNPDRPDHRDHLYGLEERIYRSHQLPKKVDLWPNVPPIWDQGNLGSCTAHGSLRGYLTEAIRQGEQPKALSRLMQYFDARSLEDTTSTDSGATVRDAIKALGEFGCAPETDWPYDVARFAERPPARAYADAKQHMAIKYQSVRTGGPGAPVRTALASGLAVVFGFSVPRSFEDGSWDPSSEPLPLPDPSEGFLGGHCVTITGYDFTGATPYFICDNSWGSGWGGSWSGEGCTGGRFALSYKWFGAGLASDPWVLQAVT